MARSGRCFGERRGGAVSHSRIVDGGQREPRALGLVPAFLVALALHVGAVAGLALFKLAPPSPPGEQQVTIDLAPLMTDTDARAPSETQANQAAPPEGQKPVDDPAEAEPTKPPPEAAEVL